MLHKLQYISQGNTAEEQVKNSHEALQNGCKWIQLRFKNGTYEETFTLATQVQILCQEYQAQLIINDNVPLAHAINADGVHLGLNDMAIYKAREILGCNKIIGGTANSFEDIQKQIQNGCDYIGLGPYRFTKTKDNLSPILGLEGYQSLIKKTKNHDLTIPIYAIGGIAFEDVEQLMQTGIYGIAVSGLITDSPNKKELITQLNEQLYDTVGLYYRN